MSIMEHNGGSVVAMAGKDCVAIASDLRLGAGAMTVAMNFEKIFPVSDRIYLGLTGLATDITTLRDRFRYLVNMFTIKESRTIEPSTFAHLVSSTLYSRRFGPYFTEPVIAGLERTPSDLIGCLNFAEDFIVAGTASDKLFGVAEDNKPTLLNSVDRDAYSGWGAIVYVITPEKVITRTLKGRMD
ncbi:20S proteasome subunit beta 3 [Lactarius hatsudake]|nr:20S proteasome subunit beta 3 [Lactarius hatsudake]